MILFNPAALGDTILTTPLLSALKETFPEENINYVTTKSSKVIVENNPHVSALEEIGGHIDILKRLKNTKKEERLLILRKHPIFYLESLLLGKKTYGFDKDGFFNSLKIKNSKNFQLIPFSTRYFKKHETSYYLDLMRLFGVEKAFDQRTKFYFSNSFAKKKPKEGKYVVLCPISGNKSDKNSRFRNWPTEYYVALAKKLSSKYHVVICGKTDDERLLNKLKGARADVLVNTLGIEETAWILKNSELVVTNDSGLLHLSAAVDAKRMIGLFGPTSPIRVMPPWKKEYQYLTPKGRDPHIDYYTSNKISEYFSHFGWPSVEDVMNKTREFGL